MLKLTPRQQTFLDKLFDLYRECKGPVHYSMVADKLGVNKFSAYDMLKVLEEKGVAASDYVLNNEQSGPGRSQVVFYPTNKAAQFLTQLKEEMRYSSDWQKVKGRILNRLAQTREKNPLESVLDILSNLTDSKSPLNYCAEMISVMLLNIERTHDPKLLPVLQSINTNDQVGFGTLAGLSLASTLTSDVDDAKLTDKLMTHTQNFQKQLTELSDESVSKLSSLFKDAISTLQLQPEFAV
jgi:DNA-binding PadR family transcriptional regulator